MPTLLIAAALCMVASLLVAIMVWMTIIRLRDRRDSSEVVPLEVAVCIRKNNGNIIIRQQRVKSGLGIGVGFFMVAAGLALVAAQLFDPTMLNIEPICVAVGLLVLGALVVGVSARGFPEPHVVIDTNTRTIEFRFAGLRGKQLWSFDVVAGVIKQSQLKEDMLLLIAEAAIAPENASSNTNRTIIGLQHTDGQNVRICTATKQAARRVPEMIAAAIGKPVFPQ